MLISATTPHPTAADAPERLDFVASTPKFVARYVHFLLTNYTVPEEVLGSLMFTFLTHTKSNINSLELPASPVYAADPSASLMGAPS